MPNTNAGRKLYICPTPLGSLPLDAAAFAALAYTEITGVGDVGQTGPSTNILNYPQWDTDVQQKSKGIVDGGAPTIELARKPTDAGQVALAAAALTNSNYAFKVAVPDGTNLYNAGIVTGPTRPNGRNEDFDLEIWTLGVNQREVKVNPVVGNPPVNTVLPAITGTVQVANVLTCSTGTWVGDATITYTRQWRLNGVSVPGATGPTYTPVVADIGKYASCQVIATNPAGIGHADTAPTVAIIA